MINIKERCLCAFQQNVGPLLKCTVQHVDRVVKIGKQSLCVFVILRDHRIDIHQWLAKRGKQCILLRRTFFDCHTEPITIAHFTSSHADSFHFVGIRRPNAFQGGAEFGVTAQGFTHCILSLMPRKNQMRQR